MIRHALLAVFLMLTHSASADTLAERLYANFNSIEAVSCEIRRDESSPDGRMRWLSRIAFAQPDRLFVENVTPIPRLIIADGETMYQLKEGQRRGFRRAIADLDEPMRQNLRKVPGTPMDHLERLLGLPEQELDAGEWPVQRAYETDRVYVVLQADEEERLQRLTIAPLEARTEPTAIIDFRQQEEVLPGVWVSMLQESVLKLGDVESKETLRVSNFVANPEHAPDQFDPATHLPDKVEWVDRFKDLGN
jgi:outer membrane lipoprotein-sorting protein